MGPDAFEGVTVEMEQLEFMVRSTADDLQKKIGTGACVIVMAFDTKSCANHVSWRGERIPSVFLLEMGSRYLKESVFKDLSDKR
jgi:hypothetical protein